MLQASKSCRSAAAIVCVLSFLLSAPVLHARSAADTFFSPSIEQFNSCGRAITVERFDPYKGGRRPAVIIVHGSDGLGLHGQTYHDCAQLLASNGYVAFIVHYYDATGDPGKVSLNTVHPEHFQAWMQTVSDAITYAQRQQNVNSNRIALMGFSLGGYVALSVSTYDRRVRAVVDLFGGLPEQYTYGAGNMPPTMIIHGEGDKTVPVKEAYRLDKILSELGIPHELAIFSMQGHIFDDKARNEAIDRVRQFLIGKL